MREGRGAEAICFPYQIPCMIFFFLGHSMNIFQDLLARMILFFHLVFLYIFFTSVPPPYKFSNVSVTYFVTTSLVTREQSVNQAL